jgi:hypothetical protein
VQVDGVWQERSITEKQRGRATHGICPDCRVRAEEGLDSEGS